MPEYISHPLIKEKIIERRSYQVSIAATVLMHNTLVILPTGLGKTVVAAFVIASRLHNADGKVLFLAPTRPLVEQHTEFLRKVLNIESEKIISLSGEVSPEKRAEMYDNAVIIVSTPQVIENDIIAGRISLENFVHITFDEAHRAVGNYAYVFIAKKFLEESKDPLILAITASPGSDVERIQEVVDNLGIEEIEIRTEFDRDVKPYIHEKDIEWIKVEMPAELREIRQKFFDALKMRYERLKKLDIVNLDIEHASKKELLAIQEAMQSEAAERRDSRYYDAVSILAEIMKILHAVELIETQGLDALKHYLKRLMTESRSRGSSKASRKVADDVVFRNAVLKAFEYRLEHPKLQKLKEIVKNEIERNPDSRIIVFTNFRDTAEMLSNELNKIEGLKVSKFIGQASRVNEKGMQQKQQVEVLNKFREGEINVLVSTSVGEEGLDIPATDLVVFYEAVPSEIRAIQRRGRTGRARKGRIAVLMTKGTRDEGYYYTSLRKEKMMYSKLYELKESLSGKIKSFRQKNLEDFIQDSLRIYADSRESRSGVVKKLHDMGIQITTGNLDVADYVVSDRVAVERKTVNDFVESLIKKDKLFNQLFRMKKTYIKPVLIIEGDGLYRRNVHPNAIRGALAAITIDFGIPILFTANAEETAEMIASIAAREQKLKQREVSLHSDKLKRSLKEQQEYLVASISNIGPVIAKNLLKHFNTIERIAIATEEELVKVPKIGKKTAEKIRKLMTAPYNE
ncbi:MAG TPA: DEAD/DEAH box helicase [Archaeoglobaceae archaeon]|nr:DEAD/DEAH box helicase [Archaeoglobaceae archaeon]